MQAGASACAAPLAKLHEQARRQHTPVIALAPNRQAAAVAHVVSGGAVECIMKPVSFEKLYASTRATVERGRLVVLLGDDDVLVREIMAQRFKSHGFSVVGANDGTQVIELACRHQPSIIVLDRIMPGLEGVAVLQMLKSNPATHEIPVVILSAKRKPDEIKEARRAGACDYIVKPFTPEHVVVRCMHELGVMPPPVAA
jgi:DNA-binding response OmpR family regulator